MTTVSSNMIITDETLSQISRELLGTEEIHFDFTHILVGDGEFPLENNSGPILNHVYNFPVELIARNRNNILLSAVIDENAFLTIKELALYCNYSDGTKHIFSKLSGLNVKKKADLIYRLIIHVNLNLNVVNTVAFPKVIIKDVEYINTSEFTNVKDIYAYTIENLERMIKTNALGIGAYLNGLSKDKENASFLPLRPYGLNIDEYGKMSELKPVGVGYNQPQTFYKYYDSLKELKNSYFSLFNYSNLKAKFSKEPEFYTEFDKDLVKGFGSAIINSDGTATIPSTEVTGRIQLTTFTPMDFNKWNYTVSFKTPKNTTNTLSILNFCNKVHYQPMVLDIINKKCRLRLGSKSSLNLNYNPGEDQEIENITCYNGTNSPEGYIEWIPNTSSIPNLHVNVVGSPTIASTDVYNFTSSDYLTTNKISFSDSNWTFNLSFNTGETAGGTIFSYGEPTSSGLRGLTFYISGSTDKTLNVSFSFDGSTVGGTISVSNIENNMSYKLSLVFDGSTYSLLLNGTVVGTLSSSSHIWTSSNVLTYFGVSNINGATSNPFSGSISLLETTFLKGLTTTWTAACLMDRILTTDISPSAVSTFYDQEKFEMPSITFSSFFEGNIIEQDLFDVQGGRKYIVNAEFNRNTCKIDYSEDGGNFVTALNMSIGNSINTVSDIIIGATYSAYDDEYTGQFSGTLYLDGFKIGFSWFNFENIEKFKKEYKFTKLIEVKDSTSLVDYFAIPEYTRNYFKVNDLCEENPDYSLEVLDGVITGFKDNIDFTDPNGFTLVTKAYLRDIAKSKVILAKGDVFTGEFYFILEFIGKADSPTSPYIKFTYYLGDQSVVITKNIYENEVVSYTSQPITFFIMFDGAPSPTIKIYKNNNLIAVRSLASNSSLNPKRYFLTSKLDEIEEGEDNRTLYGILSFSGILNNTEIYHINNLLDTNF